MVKKIALHQKVNIYNLRQNQKECIKMLSKLSKNNVCITFEYIYISYICMYTCASFIVESYFYLFTSIKQCYLYSNFD